MEILSAFVFLSISYKSISLLYPSKYSIQYLAIISLIIYSSWAFSWGDSAEEFCLPLIAYALFVGLKTIVSNRHITPTQAFFVGLTAAAVLWIKYTMVGFYIGWIACLIYIYIKNNWHSKIASTILYALIGLIALSIPILTYFSYHNSIDVMLNVYFFNNATHYSGGSIPLNLAINIIGFIVMNFLLWSLILCSIVFHKSKKLSAYLLLSFATTLIFIYSFNDAHRYYALILSAFAPFGVSLFNISKRLKPQFNHFIIMSSLIYCIYLICNNPLIFSSEKDTPQYKFDKIISQESNPTILNYGFLDGGFYTYSGLVPSNRFFCRLNIPIPEMMQEQDSIISNCGVKFMIAPNNVEVENYHKIAEAHYLSDNITGDSATYILYKLNDSISVSANKIQN